MSGVACNLYFLLWFSSSATAGIKNDAQKAKETGGTYDPNSVGTAWSHNFLNQKPWHPVCCCCCCCLKM